MWKSLCFFIVFGAQVWAEPRQAGNVIVDVPSRWEVNEQEVGPDALPQTVLLGEDWLEHPGREVRITRGAPHRDAASDTQGWAEKTLRAHLNLDPDERFRLEGWTDLGESGGHTFWMTTGLVIDADDGDAEDAVVGVVVRAGDRLELAYADMSLGRFDDEAASLRATADRVITTMTTARFVSAGAKPLIGPPKPGPLDGVYFGNELVLMPQFDGTMGSRVRDHIYTFAPNGRFFEGIPPGGIANMNDPEVLLRHTHSSGTYRLRGNTLELSYASGETDELERDGDAFSTGGSILRQVGLLPAGSRIAATFSLFNFTPLAGTGGYSSSFSSGSDTVFQMDGTFARSSFAGASGAGFALSSEKETSGRYTVGLGELTMLFGDGKKRTLELFIYDSDDGPSLWIDGDFVDLPPGAVLPEPVFSVSSILTERGSTGNNPLVGNAPRNPLAGEAPRNPLATTAPAVSNPLSKTPVNPLSNQ